MQRQALQNLLTEVAYELVVKINKNRLLRMLGYKYEKPSAWQELLDMWVELGFSKETLYAVEENVHVVLISVVSGVTSVVELTESE